jgi:hypothetical protein
MEYAVLHSFQPAVYRLELPAQELVISSLMIRTGALP